MRTAKLRLYQYAELDDSAKAKAREWYLSGRDSDDFEFVLQDAAEVAAILGITLDTRPVKLMGGGTRYEPCIGWSLGYSQGDGASFTGTYAHKRGLIKALRAYCTDERLFAIARRLIAIQRPFFYRLTARCSESTRGQWTHVVADLEGSPQERIADAEKELAETLRDFAQWIYQQLRAEDEYQCSEPVVAEAMEANQYEFTADGKLAPRTVAV